MPEDYLPQGQHLLEKFKVLHINNLLPQWEAIFRTEYQGTWIEAVIASVDGEGRAGLQNRVNDENLGHPIKTPVTINAKSIRKKVKQILIKNSLQFLRRGETKSWKYQDSVVYYSISW